MKFSTGATYELYQALTELGRRAERDYGDVVTFLERRMHAPSRSGTGFALYPVPSELGSQGLAGLAELLAQFGSHLCQETPEPTLCDMSWDRAMRLNWLSVVLDLREMALTATATKAGDLRLPLSPTDSDHCRYLRLEWRTFGVLARTTRTSEALTLVEPSTALVHLDGLIELARKLHGTDPDFYPDRLADLLCKRAEVLDKAGHRQAAVAAYREAIHVEHRLELKAVLQELVETMEEPGR